jgi:TonB family protein
MKGTARFGIVVWLICCAFLFAQSNPTSTEQKQEAPASSSGSPSQAPSADGHAPPSTPPGVTPPLMNICAPHPLKPSRCATPPHAVFAPDPEYSEEARKVHYEGTCVLWTIVGTDGRVYATKVARKLGHGLDEKAIEAVKLWKFEPAMYEGKPVAVQINIEVTFRMDDVVVSPSSAQLVTGAKQQFSATVSDAKNSAVKWSVGGSGCAASACGSVSTDGRYTAPLSVPNPATVIVTATSAADPTKMGSAKVTIQPSPSQ